MKSRLEGKRILLGVTGGIAAYKSAYLVRLLRGEGAVVKVIMTRAACEFVGPLTFETLSENKVHIHMFGSEADGGGVSAVEHIDLAKWADILVVAPVTANTLAKLARGGADDLLSTVATAYEGPAVLAPAMNDVMWRNETTQANLSMLTARGFRVIPPGTGDLACGYEAEGRMAEPETIVDFIGDVCGSDFAGLRVLVSVGGTEEDLDPVRVITNRSSGRMGFALAEAARNRGALVTAVVGHVSVPPPVGVRVVRVRTSADMSLALKEHFAQNDVLIMAAAVSDFAPSTLPGRKQKGESWTIELRRTEDNLASLGKIKEKKYIIGFALETENLEANSLKKLIKKKCDLIVVNNPLEKGAAFEYETNAVTLYNAAGKICSTGLKSKHEIADIILQTAMGEDAFRQVAK